MPSRRSGIFKESNGTYRINTKVRVSGKTIHLTRRGFKSQQEAYIEKERLINEILLNEGLTERENFKYLVDLFIEYRKPQLKDSNIYRIDKLINKYFSVFFSKQIYQVASSRALTDFINSIDKLEYSIDYKNKIIRALKEILTYGYNRGIISNSDFKNINLVLIPLKDNSVGNLKEIPILTKSQYKQFLDVIPDDTRDKVLFSLWGQLGARIGEIRGLQVKHFDAVDSTITITQQANSKLGTGKFEITTPKSKKSNRIIHISESMSNDISRYIMALDLKADDFLFFGKSKSSPLSEHSIREAQKKYSKLAGVPYIKPHGIRHSNTTWLLSGITSLDDIGAVSERLGHSSKKITLDIYFHINKVKKNSLIDILDF